MIQDNITQIKERIIRACLRVGRDPRTLVIVAVSKNRAIEEIIQALGQGIEDIGENRVQEAVVKYNALASARLPQHINWHMVGHLQTNKVKQAVRIFDLIHSVDSLHLALEIDKAAAGINKIQDILIEVKTSQEETKFGLSPEETPGLIKQAGKLKNLSLKGLMTIAPLADDPKKSRQYFRRLKELRDEINTLGITPNPLGVLSMGMSDDFEAAIEEGSNMVRLGRAIFGL